MRPRDVLADNLKKLMAAAPGLSTFPQITKAGGGSNGTLDRIRRKDTATGVDNLAAIAEVFGVQPWQLLVPTLAAQQSQGGKPEISGTPDWPFSLVDRSLYETLEPEQRGYVQTRLLQAIEECRMKKSRRQPTTDDLRLMQESLIPKRQRKTPTKKSA